MGSVIDGEDVVQDTFARAFVALDEWEESAPMRAWLFRIAHNRALDLLRSRAIRPAEPIEAAQDVADPGIPDRDDDAAGGGRNSGISDRRASDHAAQRSGPQGRTRPVAGSTQSGHERPNL